MDKLTDGQIVKELLRRLDAKDRAYHDLQALTKKMESLNNRLLDAEKVRSSFISNIRNEINNPLTSVLTMCEVILADADTMDMETVKSVVGTMFKEAFNLNFQLNNVFIAAELESGFAVPSYSNVDIESLIKSAIDTFKHRMVERDLKVSVDFSKDMNGNHVFCTDSEKIQNVLFNLIANAIEYSYDGGHIEIKVWKTTDNHLDIAVIDHGMGIDPADHQVIFERFKQLDTGVSKRHAGHGLGLSITKAAIDLIDGKIKVHSKKGSGAAFTITVPEGRSDQSSGVYAVDGSSFFFDDADGNGGTNEKF